MNKLLSELETDNTITLGRGKVISKEEILSFKGNFPVYSSSATNNGEFGRYGKYMFEDERITWSIDGGGKFFYRPTQKYSVTNVCGWLKVNNTKILNTKYVYYCLLKQWHELKFDYTYKAHPSVIRKIYKIDILDIKLQEKIVRELDLINETIDLYNNEILFLDELIKSRFVEMFGKYQANKTIGELSLICRGSSPRPISNFITNGEGENWIKIGDVGENDIYITHTAEKVTKSGADKSRRVKPGDFILSNSMSFGRPYILGINGCVHDGWLIISDYQNTFEPLFFYYLLRSPDIQAQFDGSANGACVRNLNSELVKKVKIKTPPLDIQKEFVNFTNKIDEFKFIIQQQQKNLNELLDKKMDEYFNVE